MEIVRKKIEDLNPAEYNPRVDLKPGDKEYDKLKRSIEQFDHVLPVVWNKKTGNLVGGHQTVKVLKDLGRTEVDVSVVNLSKKQEKVLNVALNRIQGDWDYAKLGDLMKGLEQEERMGTGFDADEIVMLVKDDDPIKMPEDESLVGIYEKPGETPDGPNCNRSFVVYMTFKTREAADTWLQSVGLNQKIKDNARTLVVQEGDIPRPAPSTSS